MRLSPTYLRLVLAGLLFPYLFSCSRHSADLPVPTASVQAPELTISEVQTWYQQHYATTFSTSPATLSNGSSSRTAAGGSTPLRHTHLVWPRALTVGHGAQTLVLVPLAGDQAQALFAGHWQGTRYLVVTKKENQALDGNLLELLLRRTNTPVDTLALFTSLYRSYHAGQVAAPTQGEGYLIAYTPGYVHIAGKHFLNGQLLAGNVRLKFFPSSNSSHLKGGSATSPQVPNGSGTLPTSPIANATNGGCGTYYNSGNGEDEYIDTIDCGNYVYDGNPDPTMPDGGGYSGPGDYGGTGDSGGGGGDSTGGTTSTQANAAYLVDNPMALFGPCPGLNDGWKKEITFKPSAQIMQKISGLNFGNGMNLGGVPVNWAYYVQSIGNASGALVNLDFHYIYFNSLPVIDGQQTTLNSFADYLRLNLGSLTGTPFTPSTHTGVDESYLWTHSVVGTVLEIGIPGDPGAVICSEYTQASAQVSWVFTTIHDPYVGDHPVSGTRSFGLQDIGSGYIFYTQGADRLTGNADAFAAWLTGLGNTANGIQFTSADALWEKAMRSAGLLLDPNSNPYSVGTPTENRPKFADILSAIQNGRPLSTVPCN